MELHKIQRDLLQILQQNADDPLTVREIQTLLDLSSPSLVHHHIKQLEKKKYIKRNPNNPKDYKILNDPDKLISFINLYGMARCGPEGTLLSGDPIDRIPLSPKFIKFNIEEAFLVKALGDSMEPEIHENDFIIGKIQQTADSGNMVICSIDCKIMIKKFFLEGDSIMLTSINKEYSPILVKDPDSFIIEGIVKGIICNHL